MRFIKVEGIIVNLAHIVCIARHRDGSLYVELDNDKEIRVEDEDALAIQVNCANEVKA